MKRMISLAFNSYVSTGICGPSTSSTTGKTNDSINSNIISDSKQSPVLRGRYSIFEVANWFLAKESMTHKKLQKLCYYAQAWFYTLKGIVLEDTEFEAWVHGPVSPELYDRFKGFEFNPIRMKGEYKTSILPEDQELLESVWETYGDHTGNALEALSHSESPWIEARKGCSSGERCSNCISLESMKEYYQSIYSGGEA